MTKLIQIQQQPDFWFHQIHSTLDELGVEGTQVIIKEPRTNAFCFIAELLLDNISLDAAAKRLVAETGKVPHETQETGPTLHSALPG